MCIPKKNGNVCSSKNLYTNVYSSIIQNRQKLETTQMPLKWGMDKQIVVQRDTTQQ